MCGNNSRWNPTKEQIDMLEAFYKSGITTPNADQIQHMTSKLRVFGDIEGKNVFYWFQNHKARQRQRQARHSYNPRIHLINHQQFLHNQISSSPLGLSPVYPSLYTNGFCSSKSSRYCSLQAGPSFYPSYAHQQYQTPKMLLPPRSTFIARSAATNINGSPSDNKHSHHGVNYPNYKQKQTMACSIRSTSSADQIQDNGSTISHRHETLPLFPIYPTGILQSKGKEKNDSRSNNSSSSSSANSHREDYYDANAAQSGSSPQFFDFFATH